jgi:secreted PhoX family phosphatase
MAEMARMQDATLGRRMFLRTFGFAATAVATTGALRDEAHADTETPDEIRKSRYRETEHVKTFYRVNRDPTK